MSYSTYIYLYSKVAWFELWKQGRSILNKKGGGYANEFSPLPDKPPRISTSGLNNNEWNRPEPLQPLQQRVQPLPQGKYFQIISPDSDADKCDSKVRDTITKR